MKHAITAVAFAVTVAGCSTTSDGLKSTTDTSRNFTLQENYQQVYRRTRAAFVCNDGAWAGVFASSEIEAELYPDLGFAEVSSKLQNFGAANYYWTIELRSLDGATDVVIYAGNTLQNEGSANFLESVVRGTDKGPCS